MIPPADRGTPYIKPQSARLAMCPPQAKITVCLPVKLLVLKVTIIFWATLSKAKFAAGPLVMLVIVPFHMVIFAPPAPATNPKLI